MFKSSRLYLGGRLCCLVCSVFTNVVHLLILQLITKHFISVWLIYFSFSFFKNIRKYTPITRLVNFVYVGFPSVRIHCEQVLCYHLCHCQPCPFFSINQPPLSSKKYFWTSKLVMKEIVEILQLAWFITIGISTETWVAFYLCSNLTYHPLFGSVHESSVTLLASRNN